MNGRIKIFSKAIMLNQNMRMTVVIVFSALILLLSNNLFILGKYLYDYLQNETLLNFFSDNIVSNIGFALLMTIIAFISLVAVMPLKYGREIWFYENAKKNKLKISKLFFAYSPKHSIKCIRFCFTLFFIKLAWFIAYLIPAIGFSIYLAVSLSQGISQTMLLLTVIAISLTVSCGLYFYFVTTQRYILSYIVFYENKDIGPIEAIRLSAQIMDNNCFACSNLKLSFIPWFFLCLLIFPIAYVYPYYKLSTSFYAVRILSGND
ncbi:MAG: DUF975 family protein [Clostridia bacterium]|nr:DUF975 family protein [Clostridia bacterium]